VNAPVNTPEQGLEQALDDYLRLCRSLGHELAEAGWLLPRFVAYLGARGSGTVTIEAALAWAHQPDTSPGTSVGPRRMTAVRASPATWPASTPTPKCRRWT
jgi:hypothetical protein